MLGTVALEPLPDVGAAFRSDGSTLAREPTRPPPVSTTSSGRFPNLLEIDRTSGATSAYVPGTCSSPNGPFRFNVNVQSCLSTIDVERDVEAFKTLNMNVGVNFEPAGTRLFNTNPFAVAFKRSTRRRVRRARRDRSPASRHARRDGRAHHQPAGPTPPTRATSSGSS